MILLRRVIGDALRARRQAQHRTLREVSTAANVSLGYLSEIERGQKEASSELLAAVCDALGARLSEVLREVSSTVASSEQREGALPEQRDSQPVAVPETPEPAAARLAATADKPSASTASARAAGAGPAVAARPVATLVDGDVSVTVRQDGPLSTRLTARTIRRDVLTGV
jgi:transcriptional regulator with XRE-family HTH domain